jgi:prepilin-type N-terminal cleavage/methylation domain-containing protein
MRRRGFTLIELLISFLLAAVLMTLFAQVFRTATFGRERVQEVGTRTGALRRCFETMNRDIHSSTIPPDDSGVQFGLSTTGATAGTGADVLQFASVVGEPLLAGRAANETVLIQYLVTEDPRTGQPSLWRYETPYPIPDSSTSQGGVSEDTRMTPLLQGVTGATYLFYSSTQQTWVNTWDGETGLPTAIRVDLVLSSTANQSDAKLQSWVFSVPAGSAATDAANEAASEAEEDATGTSTTTPSTGNTGGTQ